MPSRTRGLLRHIAAVVALTCAVHSPAAASQAVTGALLGTLHDQQGLVVPGARVEISSPALLGGPAVLISNEKGQVRSLALPPGWYVLKVRVAGFTPHREESIRVGAGATIELRIELKPAGHAESVVVSAPGSRIEARHPGFGTRFGPEDLAALPTRRASMFDFIRAAPGISPTSPSSGGTNTVSAFGSGTNENTFLIDGTNFTTPINGVARTEPGVDFIQEIHVQSIGASVEYGNAQGAVINVVTRQGSNNFQFDASFYGQPARLTSKPVRLALPAPQTGQSGFVRAGYRDFTANVGGPIVRDRLWFFTGYQYLRDSDSQPGTDPTFPRRYEMDKIFAKLTWRLALAWQLVQSFHDEFWVNPQRPTVQTPFDATGLSRASVPATSFGHLTHTWSANTLWDARAGRVVYSRDDESITGLDRVNRFDRLTNRTSGGPVEVGSLWIVRTTAASTITHYRPAFFGADHQLKAGAQVERGEHESMRRIPTGERFVDNGGEPWQVISRDPSTAAGLFIIAGAFVSDALTLADRLTINAGLRFDHSRAISQDVRAVDLEGQKTNALVRGLGTLYTWNIVSPRLGVTAKLTANGRTMLRGSYGRFSQGVVTGELSPFHPAQSAVVTTALNPRASSSTVAPTRNLELDRGMRAPRTHEYSIGVDREVSRQIALAVAYVRKDGSRFIGWTDVAGQYREEVRTLPDGRSIPLFVLTSPTTGRRFLLTNPDEYSMSYNGLVMVAEKRRSHGWQAFGSYTYSRSYGLLPSSGTTAAGPQVSTVAPPEPITFGRDRNDLTNARGRLANDRPHMFRVMGSVDVPRTGLAIGLNLQHFSGKPWAATARTGLLQGDTRLLLEPRGSRRLSSQTLFDLRLSKRITFRSAMRVELMLDVLNLLDDTAAEGVVSDTLWASDVSAAVAVENLNFGKPNAFIDPRRAMLSVRLNLGR